MGHTLKYFPFALWIEASKDAPYLKKLLDFDVFVHILRTYKGVEQ